MFFRKEIYEIEFPENCKEEISEIYQYISENLVSENSEKRLMRKLRNKVNYLSYNPEIYEKIHRKNLRNQEFRKFIVDNYVILYAIDKPKKIVYISHMYYNKRNYYF